MTSHAHSPAPVRGATTALRWLRHWSPLTLALFGSGAMASAAVMAWHSDAWGAASVQADTAVPLPLDAVATVSGEKTVASRKRARRCGNCGVVESIRRIDAAADSPAGWQFTVRMRDGSTRLSTSESVGGWRHGDAIMLLGGPVAART